MSLVMASAPPFFTSTLPPAVLMPVPPALVT
jgi:hypothetical protein